MEYSVWAFLFTVLTVVFNTLNNERNRYEINEKCLLKRYVEIKKIPSEYRVSSFKKWESDVVKAVKENDNDNDKKHTVKIVQLRPRKKVFKR